MASLGGSRCAESAVPASSLSSSVHAAPFVPTGMSAGVEGWGGRRDGERPAAREAGFGPKAASSGDFLRLAGRGGTAGGGPGSGPEAPSGGRDGGQARMKQLSPDAAAFVPRGGYGGTSAAEAPGRPRGGGRNGTYPAQQAPQRPGMKGRFVAYRGGQGGRYAGRGRGGRGRQYPYSGGAQGNLHGAYFVSPGKMTAASKFMGEQLRRDLVQRSCMRQAQLTSEAAAELGLPPLIQNFHSLCPLEDLPLADEQPSVSLGIRTCVIKGVSMVDGAAYGLRRIDGRQVLPSPGLLKSAHETVQRWSCVANHPNAVGLRGVFASSEYGGVSSLYFVHDYHPGAVSLHFRHLQSQRPASEDELWSYLTQLAAVTRVAHSSGLAFRPECLIPSKVLLTSGGRLRVGSIGILDVLDGERVQNEDLTVLQRRDLLGVGKLILSLATVGCEMGVGPLDHCGLHYSVELVRLINSLMMASEGNHLSSWQHLAGALSERSLAALDSANMHNDALLHELAKEVENGRLLRLLVKLGLINERPGGNFSDSDWSETGDRYLLKLFRDFVFHQSRKDGTPIIDWGHIVECLNKVDAGVPENIVLLSRDEKQMLVVSYGDIKKCVETSFEQLKGKAESGRPV